jgi:flagellar hook assembly protein FlgD
VDNAELVVSFELSEPTGVDARVYNTSGRLIKTLWIGLKADVGENVIRWDGRESGGDYANDGLYVLVIEADGKKVQKTFVVVNN